MKIRIQLKNRFPNWKFQYRSIRYENYAIRQFTFFVKGEQEDWQRKCGCRFKRLFQMLANGACRPRVSYRRTVYWLVWWLSMSTSSGQIVREFGWLCHWQLSRTTLSYMEKSEWNYILKERPRSSKNVLPNAQLTLYRHPNSTGVINYPVDFPYGWWFCTTTHKQGNCDACSLEW